MRLVAAILIGVLAYVGLNVWGLRKPLTIGYIREAYDHKLAHAAALGDARKIVVVGGSSSLYGVRCQVLAAETGLGCVNMAVTAGIGVDLVLAKADPVVRPGDIVLMPLEFDFVVIDGPQLRANPLGNAYAVTYDRALLAGFDPHRQAAALLGFSLRDVVGALTEMALHARGIRRRFLVSDLTPEGDMTGHTPAKAAAFTAAVARMRGAVPTPGGPPETAGRRHVESFIARMLARGAVVVGTWPATVDDSPPRLSDYDAYRRFWTERGAEFLDLPGLGRFPLAAMYDTHYHLNEPAQIAHSRALGAALRHHP